MALSVMTSETDVLDGLPAPARPRVDPADVVVPAGYRVSVAVVGLSVGREPDRAGTLRTAGATVLAKTRQAIGHLEGTAGGAASGVWRTLREVLLTDLDAIAGFAVTEQLGLALGIPAVVDITFPIGRRKTQDQLLLQEYLLEMASNAILRGKDF